MSQRGDEVGIGLKLFLELAALGAGVVSKLRTEGGDVSPILRTNLQILQPSLLFPGK